MTKKELMRLSQRELFKACRNQGKDTSGDKAAMAARLAVPENVEPKVSAPEETAPEETAPEAPPEVD